MQLLKRIWQTQEPIDALVSEKLKLQNSTCSLISLKYTRMRVHTSIGKEEAIRIHFRLLSAGVGNDQFYSIYFGIMSFSYYKPGLYQWLEKDYVKKMLLKK